MKQTLTLIVIFLTTWLCSIQAQVPRTEQNAAFGVIKRVYPQLARRLTVEAMPKGKEGDAFEQQLRNGKLIVKGSSGTAICRGVYDFLRHNKYGISGWKGNRMELPSSFHNSAVRSGASPFRHHYYFNVVTYGYTMPYWDWARWEKEIDWMALHGIDMPLALVANEAISARVWRKLGLTEQEINSYFVGPAHLPWMRMGNISGIDGPLPRQWHKEQIALQHKILNRMKSLGMKPICPAFAGFVPQAFKRLYPHIKITETSWGGAFHNWFLSPQEQLFQTIGQLFIKEWEKEFGKNTYYIADSFNEMDIPFPPKGNPERYSLLASYGEKVYESIKAGNNNAVWVMQGWMFGYQRHIWDEQTLGALVSKVPDEKMLLLDLAVDYNTCFWHNGVNWEFYKGFFNKPWVYSVIPNMGGKSGMTGILSFYANAHLQALKSPNKGQLTGFGMAPEGIENNEVVYELLCDAGWSTKEIDVTAWLSDYSLCRYGKNVPGIDAFWQSMLGSVYGSFTDHPRYNWQLRPGLQQKGTINANETFCKGVEALAKNAMYMKGNTLFELDFREWTAAYLGIKLEQLTQQINEAYRIGDARKAGELEEKFVYFMQATDRLLAEHPTKDMQRWIDLARSHGRNNTALADYYEKNARRIVTIWGPPVDDYSARIWAGLIRDYYLPRWKHYFEQQKTGVKFDFPAWEKEWVERRKGLSIVAPFPHVLQAAVRLIGEASCISAKRRRQEHVAGTWQPADVSLALSTLQWNVPAQRLRNLKGIRIETSPHEAEIEVSAIALLADGKEYSLLKKPITVSSSALLPTTVPTNFTGNNECKLKVILRNKKQQRISGKIEFVY